jgi:Mn2+/Fe2+ NRAMP family transporter
MSDITPEFDTVAPEFDQEAEAGIQDPPRSFLGTLMKLGPGLVIAGSIVGSGELIATTKTGAQAGIALLWLVIIGCVIKVFVQVELGRYSITHGQTTLNALNQLPGRLGPINYILWFFLVMMLANTVQQGGIVGGVGQSLAIAIPITGDYREAVALPSEKELAWFVKWDDDLSGPRELWQALSTERQERVSLRHTRIREQLDLLGERGSLALEKVRRGETLVDPWTTDDRVWATLVTLLTAALLYNGSYGIIQNLSTVMVVAFTFITLGNVIALQMTDGWSLSAAEFAKGFSFTLPAGEAGWAGITTALAAFGIIGVGATELITYPYWCIEKGYARFAGKRSGEESWAIRARGWMRVMHWDAFLSLLIYTTATVAFFLMGVSVLYREGRDPDDMRMVSTLAAAYVPIFGEYAKWLFLLGAVAVLYSTFLVASAGHARMFVDFLKICGLLDRNNQKVHDRSLSFFCVALPVISLGLFVGGINPVSAVLLAGITQAVMLPMLGFAALYFRWKATDARLKPGRLWDLALVLSFLALFVTACWGVWTNGIKAKNALEQMRSSAAAAPAQQ